MKKSSIIVLIIVFGVIQSAYSLSPGTTGHQFLKLGVGSRAVAMGNSFTGAADDHTALYWNPAGLFKVKNFEMGGTYLTLFNDVDYLNASIAIPITVQKRQIVKRFGTLGIGGGVLWSSDERRDDKGNPLGTFTNYDAFGSIGYGGKASRNLSCGIAGKFIRSKYDKYSATSIALDGGFMVMANKYFSVGGVVKNVGFGSKFIYKTDYDPMEVKVGTALYLPLYLGRQEKLLHFLITADAGIPADDIPKVSIGGEFYFHLPSALTQGQYSGIFLRSGYETGAYKGDIALGDFGGFGLGIGIEAKYTGMTLQLDQVYVPYGALGNAQRISLTLKF